jgi:ABC-type amino acid transport system permease subunit
MNLPSFLWLWKIAAWSMGLSIFAYFLLVISGILLFKKRTEKQPRPSWLRPTHYIIGSVMVLLVLLLLAVGLVGTIGHYGSLGHSPHLIAGLFVVTMVVLSAWSSTQIHPSRPWARLLHVRTNIALFFGFLFVGLSGLIVVQKYLP